MAAIRSWRHVFKLDPDRPISDHALEQICESGTDALIVGGSTGVTFDNTVELLARIRAYSVFCALEVSNQEAIVPGFDLYLIPTVLNTQDGEWIVGRHVEALKRYGAIMPWEHIAMEGYVILNKFSAAARLCNARTELAVRDLEAYARFADKLLHMPIFYVENSGAFADMEPVKRVKSLLTGARLFYGGGIDNLAKAKQAAEAAHTIIVGNAIYEHLPGALQTVKVLEKS
ncbi:MAG TPA: heptaprenylglyceryl phosphate synthase [Bacilli bacterium]